MLAETEIGLPTAYGVVTYPAGATFGPRRMRDFEFVWIIAGNVQYRYDTIMRNAPAGSVILCRPGAEDAFVWDTAQRTCHGFFHFSIGAIPPEWPAVTQWPLVREDGERGILFPLLQHVLACAKREPAPDSADALQCRLAIATLLSAFLSGATANAATRRESLPEPVERAWNYIKARLDERPADPISLAELAGAACVTPEHLCRLFRSATGWSPAQTVRLARLDRAVGLLARSNYAIGEIAVLCGFPNAFHFSEVFRAAFGQSPREMRRAVRAGNPPPTATLFQEGRLPQK